ncbi:VOC family protein [Microlunatus soli]|uniref:PhnB protein n=1 Tax=Microlunatus soli TaxID=630515 RepID=A0A1H1YFD8_9ACTN|nr:VOC family protein [Microlunatus soli]SDT20180.1 PhnB protein [Microlunatus soli]
MATSLDPYLSFGDNAREAMEFYQGVFGGELTVSTFGDFQLSDNPADTDKVMHSQLVSPGGLTLMGADTPTGMPGGQSNGTLSLSGPDEAELRGFWDKLSDGGEVTMPLEPAPWGDIFGMCTDKYGVSWMVDITQQA